MLQSVVAIAHWLTTALVLASAAVYLSRVRVDTRRPVHFVLLAIAQAVVLALLVAHVLTPVAGPYVPDGGAR